MLGLRYCFWLGRMSLVWLVGFMYFLDVVFVILLWLSVRVMLWCMFMLLKGVILRFGISVIMFFGGNY